MHELEFVENANTQHPNRNRDLGDLSIDQIRNSGGPTIHTLIAQATLRTGAER